MLSQEATETLAAVKAGMKADISQEEEMEVLEYMEKSQEEAPFNIDNAVLEEPEVESLVINLPKKDCYVCRNLNPNLPKYLPAKYGGHSSKSKIFGQTFTCLDDPRCPAKTVQVIYNPFTEEMISEAVELLKKGDPSEIYKIYEKASSISAGLRERVQEMIAKEINMPF